ncbi:MAG TPA: DNA primase, partial [Geobacteraceae bacterium]
MSMIPDDKVAEIRERASILEVVGDYVSLKRSGANYQGMCPFHGEKTASFNVNPARGIFHCFGCGVGGNVFTFIMKIEGLTFPEAVRFLAKRTGVVIEDRALTPAEKQRQDERDTLYRINDLAAAFYRDILLKEKCGEPGRNYLERRGVDEATSEAYRLGFAPGSDAGDRWDRLVRHLEQKRVPLEAAEKLGLIRRRASGGYYDLFRNRLVFTIANTQGRVIAFGARVLDDSLPKYINSPESPIYRKSEVLFGINLARHAMREQGKAIIVEGYFDHLALFQAGVKNVVATCGTALTTGHVKLLQRYAGTVYTLFDGDSAGVKATIRSMELFLDEGLPAAVIELPSEDDPDSYIKTAGAEAFAERVAKARPIFDFFFRNLLQHADTRNVAGKVAVVEELTPRLLKIGNDIERQLYVKEIARVLGVDERLLQKKIGRQPVTVADLAKPAAPRQVGNQTEEMLLALMGKYPEVAGQVREYGAARLFSPELLPVAEAILAQVAANGNADLSLILEQVASPEERSRLASLFVTDAHLEEIDARKAFEQCRLSCERKQLKKIDM